jgi:predicted HTH transcriptional regulator
MEAEQEYYISLIEKLRHLLEKTEWVEFKVDNRNPEMIGEYISALSNCATIWNKEKGYILWGINNDTHEIEGTNFTPRSTKKGNEEIENWLAGGLKPRVDFKFVEVFTDKGKVVVMEIPAAVNMPTSFKSTEYIRVGSYKKKLKEFPEKERKLWLAFETKPFELRMAMENVTASKVTELLDCAAYYTLMKLPLPSNRDAIIHNIMDEEFIREMDNGNYAITNMGALLLAKDLNVFAHLKRKAVRVIRYKGNGKTNAIREQVFTKGYAIQFDDITDYIMTLILAPKVETGEDFTRTKLYWYGKLNDWMKEDKIRTCYLYTCYCYVNEIEVANAVLRDRFGIDVKNMAVASRIIKATMEAGLIKLSDENAALKNRRYVPYWA